MIIEKIINNNAIITIDEDGVEVICLGAGIGWNTKVGQAVDTHKIEKTFGIRDKTYKSVENILKRLHPQALILSSKIINEAERRLQIEMLNDQLILALADHISFSISQYNTGKNNPNLILQEIQLLYPNEYKIGEYGVQLINDTLNIQLPSDEKGYITLHLINSGIYDASTDVDLIISLVHDISKIIKDKCSKKIDEKCFDYQRLLAHIKFLATRICQGNKKSLYDGNDLLFSLVLKDERIVNILDEISRNVKCNYDYSLTRQDKLYLGIHLLRIMN